MENWLAKVGPSPSKKVVFICFKGSPLKVINDAFYFMLKSVFVLEISRFLSKLFDQVQKRLDNKAQVYLKFMKSQTGQ